jgi:hypothetical protein
MIRKERRRKWIAVALLVTVSFLIYAYNPALAERHRPPHPGHHPIHPPGPHPGHHHPGPPPSTVLGPPAPWKAMGPPPAGRIWFHYAGSWIAVPPPPGGGPYLWNGSVWVIDSTPAPEGSKWVAGHWTPAGWIAGHWAAHPAPRAGMHWVPGHWGPKGHWRPGHWK